MTPPVENNAPYQEEEEIVNKLLRAIELASNEVIEDKQRPITRLEQEKFSYFAIDDFDLPITYSWYIEGANTKVTGEPDRGNKRLNTDSGDVFHDVGEDPDVLKYRDYFVNTTFIPGYNFKEVWYTERLEFLHDFYTHEAPEEFLNLYLASLTTREALRSIHQTLDSSSKNRSLGDFVRGTNPGGVIGDRTEREFREFISRYHLALAEFDDLNNIIPIVTQCTDILEQILAKLTTLDSVEPQQQAIIHEMEDFFYFDVWRYPALYVSANTATGPNKHQLIGEHINEFTSFDQTLSSKLTRLRSRCDQADLYPDPGHHADTLDQDVRDHLNSVMLDYIEGTQ